MAAKLPSLFTFIMTETELEGSKKLQIGTGQCSINGMDLIMNAAIQMDPPEGTGTFHVAFKLVRDSANDVLGDTKVGSDLAYKPSRNADGIYEAATYTAKFTPNEDTPYTVNIYLCDAN